MREVVLMWRDSRMIILTIVVTATYTAVLIPFKGLVLIPGFTEVRPANTLPVVFSLLFGPAAAWGSAFGNLIADVFGGTLTRGSIFGFVGNFYFGLVGYKLWGNLGPLSADREPTMRDKRQLAEFVVVSFVASTGTAAIIAWGLDILGLFSFSALGTIIAVNNFVITVVFGPIVLYVLYPLVKRDGLLYPNLLSEENLPSASPSRQRVTAIAIAGISVTWWLIGIVISVSIQGNALGTVSGAIEQPSPIESQIQLVVGATAMTLLVLAVAVSEERLSNWLNI
jgi:energy-coupling factor transport system substrate-specific component